nr:MAG TPA: hypothetical protein [Bacteriophage sp.]
MHAPPIKFSAISLHLNAKCRLDRLQVIHRQCRIISRNVLEVLASCKANLKSAGHNTQLQSIQSFHRLPLSADQIGHHQNNIIVCGFQRICAFFYRIKALFRCRLVCLFLFLGNLRQFFLGVQHIFLHWLILVPGIVCRLIRHSKA